MVPPKYKQFLICQSYLSKAGKNIPSQTFLTFLIGAHQWCGFTI